MGYIEITKIIKAVQCDYCLEKLEGDAREADSAGWNWYTGNDDKTFHICNKCIPNKKKKANFEARVRQAGGTPVW